MTLSCLIMLTTIFLGGESKNDSDYTVCCWNQHIAADIFGTRLPAVIGASYTYVPTTISIILAGRYSDVLNPQEVVSLESHLCSLMTIIFCVSNCLTCSAMVCRNSRR